MTPHNLTPAEILLIKQSTQGDDEETLRQIAVLSFERGVQAERERCAKIAEDYGRYMIADHIRRDWKTTEKGGNT